MSRVLDLAREAIRHRKLLRRLVLESSVVAIPHLSPDASGFLVPAALWGEVFEASSPELESYHGVMRTIAEGRRPTENELEEAQRAVEAREQDDEDLLAAEAEYALSLCDND